MVKREIANYVVEAGVFAKTVGFKYIELLAEHCEDRDSCYAAEV